MTKTPEKIVLDFNGTDPEAKGPINWALDEVEGRYFRKWLAPTLRSLAASPERAAEIDSNEGVLDVIDVIFPGKGTLITPTFGKPTGMRFFLMLRSLGVFAACLSKATGGRMPGDHETIRIWGLTGGRTQRGLLPLPRGARRRQPGQAVGGRLRRRPRRAQLARTCPPNSPRRAIRSWSSSSGSRQDSGGAGFRRGGIGYDKRIRALGECRLISNADRSLLGCYGVNGGKAGLSYQVSVIESGGSEQVHPGMYGHGDGAAGRSGAHRHHRRRRVGRPAGARGRQGRLRRSMRTGVAAGGARATMPLCCANRAADGRRT